MRPALPALVLLPLTLALVACGGNRAPAPSPSASAAPSPTAAPAPPPKKALTLEESFAAAAPKGRPAKPLWDRVLPGMDVAAIAKRVGPPDRIKPSPTGGQELRWRTGPRELDPDFVVWLKDGVATKMRFRDRL